jgi:dihydroorotate dehydrogenase
MAESPNITLVHESIRHLRDGVEGIGDIWRHEGLKKGVEIALGTAAYSDVSRWFLENLAGEFVFDSRLTTHIGDLALAGPVGIAPGWDKTGKTVLGWEIAGANHITPGGITLWPQKGGPMPRLRTFDKRVGDHGTSKSLNAYGFPCQGAPMVAHNIGRQKETGEVTIPVIGQVTLNKEMYEERHIDSVPDVIATTIAKILPVVDGINLGLSSPNTLGMRSAQAYEFLYRCIMTAREAAPNVPLSYKGDGDGGEERLDMYARLAEATNLDYFELINTTALERIKAKYGAEKLPGGLAGADPDYQQLALNAIRYIYEAVGDKVDIIGMGGVNSPDQAFKMIKAGASAIGINTGVRQLGIRAVSILEIGLCNKLDGYPVGTRLENIVGSDTTRGSKVPFTIYR